MSSFSNAMNASAYTANGALSYSSPDTSNQATGRVALFFKAVRGCSIPKLYEYLRVSATENLLDTFLLAFQLRDCRGVGKGERNLGRHAMIWLFVNYPKEFRKVLAYVPEYGRYDDLLRFFPKVLSLTDKDHVRENFMAGNVDDSRLLELQSLQKEVVAFFSHQLKKDHENMEKGNPVSLCAKWAPTEGDSLDAKFGVYTTLADGMGVHQKILRKKYNTPLRAYTKVVETFMCSGKWDSVEYNKVPSCAMKKLKGAFEEHDSKRFLEWRKALSLKDPKVAKVNAKQLFPHELVREIRIKGFADDVCEAQWDVLVEQVRKLGTLKDVISVVDTSGSMTTPNYVPLDVAVSLGMLISSVVEGAFHGHVITFHDTPKFAVIPDGKMYDRFFAVHTLEWGLSTNIEETFNLILDRGKVCNLKQEDMPKRLLIISDMQFNQVENEWGAQQTNMERINEMYVESGYVRPQIVFWNVNGGSSDFPCTVDEKGTVLLSGFSPAILKSLINGTDFSTMGILRQALDDPRYDLIRQALAEDFEMVD